MSRSCCMSSDGNSDRDCPSSPICWFDHWLVPEMRMFSEPETVSAGPPGPSQLCIFLGRGDGNLNDSPLPDPLAPISVELRVPSAVREFSRHRRSKLVAVRSRLKSLTGTLTLWPSWTLPSSVENR